MSCRRICLLLALSLFFGVSLAASAAVTLVSSGLPNAVILTRPSPGSSVGKAAADFQEHIQIMSGATLPIDVVGNESLYPGKNIVYIGQSSATDSLSVDASSLTYEYFRVKTLGTNTLVIVGRDGGDDDWTQMSDCWAGTMNGCAYVLGDVLGCRWLWPGDLGRYVPRSATVIVPALDVTDGPMMEQRKYRIPRVGKCYLNGTDNYNGIKIIPADLATRTELSNEEYLWWRHQRMGTRRTPDTGHSYNDWWDKFGTSHPEYFAVLPQGYSQPYPISGGEKRCKLNDSSPVVWQAVVDEWIGQGAGDGLNACPNDSKGFCICDNCLAWDRPTQDPSIVFNSSSARLSDRMAQFWSHVADLVRPINPNCMVYGYAYDVYKYAPLEATVPSNVALAYVPGAPTDTTLDGIQQTEDECLGWVEHGCQNMYLRTNWFLSSHVGPDWPLTRLGEHFIRMTATGGIKGLDSDSSCSSYAPFGPYYYMVARLMADVTLTVPEIKAEWCSAFGPAAPKMQEYLQYWEDFLYAQADAGNSAILGWQTCVAAYPGTFTSGVFDGAQVIMDQAYALLGPSDAEARARLDFMQVAIDHGRLTAAAITLASAGSSNTIPDVQTEAAMRRLLAYRDSYATSWAIWREWFIDREGYITKMGNYWDYIFAHAGYALEVINGSGSGSYHSGAIVPVAADADATGKVFQYWSGSTGILSNPNARSTNATIPASASSIKARFLCTLTVTNGSGSGNYLDGASVEIVADDVPGQNFLRWAGDTDSLADARSADTTLTMPAVPVSVLAIYAGAPHDLTVNSGAGSGTHYAGDRIVVTADAPQTGKTFFRWTGDVQYLDDARSATTLFTVPDTDAVINATYRNAIYHVDVINGSGSGNYEYGEVVSVSASSSSSGLFTGWTGDTDTLADVYSPHTTLTIPAHDVSVIASYSAVMVKFPSPDGLVPPSAQGLTLEFGNKAAISWAYVGLSPKALLRIELINGSGQSWLITERAAVGKGVFAWTVGKMAVKGQAVYPNGDDYRIRISTLDGSAVDVGNYAFAIGRPISLEIIGPDSMAETTTSQFTCIAHYDYGADRDVTAGKIKWTCLPKVLKVGKNGAATAASVLSDQACTLTVTMSAKTGAVTGSKQITITNVQ